MNERDYSPEARPNRWKAIRNAFDAANEFFLLEHGDADYTSNGILLLPGAELHCLKELATRCSQRIFHHDHDWPGPGHDLHLVERDATTMTTIKNNLFLLDSTDNKYYRSEQYTGGNPQHRVIFHQCELTDVDLWDGYHTIDFAFLDTCSTLETLKPWIQNHLQYRLNPHRFVILLNVTANNRQGFSIDSFVKPYGGLLECFDMLSQFPSGRLGRWHEDFEISVVDYTDTTRMLLISIMWSDWRWVNDEDDASTPVADMKA